MCGISGYWDLDRATGADVLEHVARAMSDRLRHRGPDGGAVWSDPQAGIGLGHRRLSIIDLSEAGTQPMVSSCGRFVIVYNGEIYNANELRPELIAGGRRFRGHSDTEVILEGMAEWGVDQAVERCVGMFALALWDRQERELTLVRDRLGIKPLYYGRAGRRVLFASELKAFAAVEDWRPEIDRRSVAAYLRFNYVPAPHSIFEGVGKLEPGRAVTIGADGAERVRTFWSLGEVARQGRARPFRGDDGELIDELDRITGEAVACRLVSDVPLGAFLSGGIDSSTVVALMQRASATPVKTFTIGFAEARYDEARHAAAIARRLGTDHTELRVTEAEALAVIAKLPEMYDEPFADASQIPTHIVSALTRGQVTVALSGDGGDEVFGGYDRYRWAKRLDALCGVAPQVLRRVLAAGIGTVSPAGWDRVAQVVPASLRPRLVGDRLHKLAGILAGERQEIYQRLVSHWFEPERLTGGVAEHSSLVFDRAATADIDDYTDRLRYLDTLTYLPDDILAKVDRASMAVGLEARVPLIDHRLIEFAWSVPRHRLMRGGTSKWALRQLLYRFVPREEVDRPKMGFAVPIETWLRGELRDWAEAHLSSEALTDGGFSCPELIRQRWHEHLSGHRNWQYHLWSILMLQAWRGQWGR